MTAGSLPLFPVVAFAGAWAAVNLAFALARRARPARAPEDGSEADAPGTTAELVSPLHLRISTDACGDAIAAAAQCRLARTNLGARTVDAFYSAGVYVSVASMALCVGVLLVAAAQIAAALGTSVAQLVAPQPMADVPTAASYAPPATLTQRLLGASPAGRQQVLRPVIPGITLPPSHVWYYLLSLGLCAAIHELGHALAAARAGIRVRRVGMFIVGIYPGAFVELARSQLESAPVAAQLRVACAGIWHNAVTALAAWALLRAGVLGLAMRSTAWAAADGVVVVDIARSSPLYGRMPLLSTVFRIDDVSMQPANDTEPAWGNATRGFGAVPIERWTSVLTATRTNRDTVRAGYCVAAGENADDGLCCEMTPRFPLGESPDSDIFCFDRFAEPAGGTALCFDLRATVARAGAVRCRSDADCGRQGRAGQLCLVPSSPFPDGRVLRLHFRAPGSSHREVLVYAGAPAALWLDVQVSSLEPRWSWVPCRLPLWAETLLRYVLSFSLALCLLNATPAWHLDGDLMLRHLIFAWEGRQRARLPAGADGSGPEPLPQQQKGPPADVPAGELSAGGQRLYAGVTLATTVLLGWCMAGSLVLLVL
ncbi:hypothetical protein H4R19_000447 [Coemansia spiralis]|nr:hypothetical protein H4R19_000447 [Coemansia spiralis]